jgi:hypothetical protein
VIVAQMEAARGAHPRQYAIDEHESFPDTSA